MLAAQSHHFPSPSTQSNPSSPTFPHRESLSLNGSGLSLSMRPSPPIGPNPGLSSFSPTIERRGPSGGAGSASGTGPGAVQGWDDEHVASWLGQVGAGQHAELFAKNDIRGGVLLDVDQSALKEMGIRSVGDRVRIAVAIKQLRQKCQPSRQIIDRFPSPTRSTFAHQNGTDFSRSSGLGRGSGRVPPPLHLTQSNADLPLAYQPSSRPTATSARSIPPLLPPPRSQPPPPPNGRSPPTQNQPLPRTSGGPPSISTTAASPTQANGSSSAYTEYGIPRVSSASSLSGYRATSASPSSTDRTRPPTGVVPARPSTSAQAGAPAQHRKPGSNVSALGQQRPSTTSSTSSYAHNQPLSSHPYATSGSPTQEGFNVPSYGRAPGGGAAAGPSHLKLSLLPSPAIAPGAALSPVSEGYSTRTGFSRPTTPAGAGTPSGSQPSSSLDAVMRKAIKFVADDGVTKMVAVADCLTGREVLVRVLRKFGKIGPSEGGDDLDTEGWAAYTAASDGGLRMLSEVELHGICQNVNAPERARGLAIQRIHQAKQNRKLQWMLGEANPTISSRPGGVAGTSPTSPNYLGVNVPYTNVEPASPSGSSSGGSERRMSAEPSSMTQQERGKMNRASTISVMSGLGAGEYLDVAQPASQSPSSGANDQSGRKLRNFFGQRPPSELIATHLTEYFPKAEKNKLLSKQVRQSMRRSMVRRDSRSSAMTAPMPVGTSWENAPDRYSLSPSAESRFSGSSGGSSGMNLPVNSTNPEDGSLTSIPMPPRPGRMSSGSGRAPALAPPDEEAEEDDELGDTRSVSSSLLAKAGRRTSRASYSSRLSVSRKDSDSASIITVDDVTAELEHRRASMASFVESDDEPEPVYIPGLAHHLRPPSIALSRDDDFDEEDEDEEEDESTEDESEEEAEVVADKPTKAGPKWIKGALIGVGAFGSVFLGMNPLSGSLMAVKQVELPTGNSHNEERKKGMLDALEREIELLKVLRHESMYNLLTAFCANS